MILFIINLLIIVLLILVIINLHKSQSQQEYEYFRNNSIEIDSFYTQLKPYYNKIKVEVFDNLPKDKSGLQFGYICPGAVKTIEYLNKMAESQEDIKAKEEIMKLTDLQFFIEIIVVYSDYIVTTDRLKEVNQILNNQSCNISKKITEKITNLFSSLSKALRDGLPDDFYHIRHNTLICSNDLSLAKERIRLLKSMYNKKENFYNYNYKSSSCLGKRNGVSGCRDCCSKVDDTDYRTCVSACMSY